MRSRLLPLLLALPLSTAAQEPSELVLDECARLRGVAETEGVARILGQSAGRLSAGLDEVERAVEAGFPLLGLSLLGPRRLEIQLAAFQADAGEDLQAVYHSVRDEVAGLLATEAGGGVPLPAAARALVDAAATRAGIYVESARAYGEETAARYGVNYLGVARAEADLVRFVRTLGLEAEGSPPELGGLHAYLARLEDDVLAGFRDPALSASRGEFNGISSLLKSARELAAGGAEAAALDRALAARGALALIVQGEPEVGALEERLAELRAHVDELEGDASLARVYLAEAELRLERVVVDGFTTELPRVAALVDAVLPGYLECVGERSGEAAADAPVTVTLVRWPYT